VSPDDVDPTRPVLHVVRQIKIVRGQLIFAPPKAGKLREVPLAESVHERLATHTGRFEPVPVTLPWDTSTGEPRTVLLYLVTPDGYALSRPKFNSNLWKPAIRRAGVATACTSYDTPTPQFSSTLARTSMRCRFTSGTAIPGSRCAPTRTRCRPARTAPAARLTEPSAVMTNRFNDGRVTACLADVEPLSQRVAPQVRGGSPAIWR